MRRETRLVLGCDGSVGREIREDYLDSLLKVLMSRIEALNLILLKVIERWEKRSEEGIGRR